MPDRQPVSFALQPRPPPAPSVQFRISITNFNACRPWANRQEFQRPNNVFRCDLCSKAVPPHTPAHRLVVQTRPRKYRYRSEVHLVIRLTPKGKRKKVFLDDPGGTGQEIVREVKVCPECALKRNGV